MSSQTEDFDKEHLKYIKSRKELKYKKSLLDDHIIIFILVLRSADK